MTVFTVFAETPGGISTVKAYKKENDFIKRICKKLIQCSVIIVLLQQSIGDRFRVSWLQ